MRIICPNCRSEYEVEADRISRRGTRVKCSSCDNVFTVYRPEGTEEPGIHTKKQARGKLGKLAGKKLYLRQGTKSYKIRDLALLQRWIIQKRVLATDELSVDGENWEQVYRLGELRPFFSLLRQLRETRRELLHTRERLREYESRDSFASGDDDDEDIPRALDTKEVLASAAEMEREEDEHYSLVEAQAITPDSDAHLSADELERRRAAAFEALESQEIDSPDEMIAAEARRQEEARQALTPAQLAEDDPPSTSVDGTFDGDEGTSESYDMVSPRPLAQVRPVGEEKSQESVEQASIEQPPIHDPDPDPVPSAADALVTDLASREIQVPEFDPAAQSIITGEQEAATVAWTPTVDEEPAEDEVGAETAEAEAPPPEELDSPAANEPEAPTPGPEEDKPTPPEPQRLVTAEEEESVGLGDDFAAFEEAHQEEVVEEPPGQEAAQDWGGVADYGSASYDETPSMEEDGVRRVSAAPYIAAAVIIVVLIALGAWYVIHRMQKQTEDQFGDGAATATADAGEPTTGAGAGGGDAAVDGGEPATADAVEPASPEEATPEEATPEEATPEPSTAEPSTPEPSTPEPWTDSSDGPEPSTPEPSTPEPSTPRDDGASGNLDALAETYNAQGAGLARTGKHGEAIEAYRRALEASPDDAEACKGIGWSSIETGQNGQAAEHFRRAIILDAMDPENHYGLGLAYEGMERYDDAINEYQTYIGLAPEGREAAEVRILLRRLLEMREGTP